MTQKLFLFILLMLVYTTLKAQGEFRYGVKVGFNLANISESSNVKRGTGARISYHVGGLAEIPFTDKISLQPELLYSRQGSSALFRFLSVDPNYYLDYLNVPMLGKYYIIKTLSVEIGPVFGYLVNADRKTHAGTFNSIDEFNNFDLAGAIGVSYRLPYGPFAGIRYNLGFLDINSNPNISGKNYNNLLQFTTGYTF